MTLRDLSYGTIVKLTLFITLTLPVIAILCFAPFVEQITFNVMDTENPLKLFGLMGIEMIGPPIWVTAGLVYVLNLLASSKALQLLARYTPLGRIKINSEPRQKQAIPPNKAPIPQA